MKSAIHRNPFTVMYNGRQEVCYSQERIKGCIQFITNSVHSRFSGTASSEDSDEWEARLAEDAATGEGWPEEPQDLNAE